MEIDKERTAEDITEILKLAKLDPDELKPVAQVIRFTPNDLYQNNFKLLQLDSNLLSEVEEGRTLYIKGQDEDDVVICTKTRTYHVTDAETSNSLLLVDNLKLGANIENDEPVINNVTVHGIFYDYLEAVPVKPRFKKLKKLLQETVYKGPKYESDIDKDKLYTFEQLDKIIQASTKELREAIDTLDVVIIDGKVRLLDFEYHFRALSYMLKLIDENSWQLDEVDYEETVNLLKDMFPAVVLKGLLDRYTEESQIVDGTQLYRYREDKVCIFFAKVLLYGAGKFNLKDFLQAWKDSVPDGMTVSEEMLYGIAVIDQKSDPPIIRPFDESDLPESLTDRFNFLFEIKEKWTVPEIAPYIQPFTTDKLDVNALLAKYARASKIDGVKYYSSKHGK